MNKSFELSVSHMSEIEALELQNEIEAHTGAEYPVELSSEPLPGSSVAGDPGLAAALLTYAPQVIPVLAAALAAWITAGRREKVSVARKLVIKRDGIMYADVKISDLERQAAGKPLEAVLERVLKGEVVPDPSSTE